MPSDAAGILARHEDALRRGFRGTAVGLALFAVLGTVTAVWANPLFVRMTPIGSWEFGATVLTALLAGVTAAFWVPQCTLRGSGTGGIASFLGIACPVCNKVLMLLFSGPALLVWFDPIRPWLAAVGVVIMGFAALSTWRRFIVPRNSGATVQEKVESMQGELK
ncbi:MAG: hypothetical protein C0524_08645 [Rhodobacter sp.]|nr:hypothetical protein [Rhodobacter sp.]